MGRCLLHQSVQTVQLYPTAIRHGAQVLVLVSVLCHSQLFWINVLHGLLPESLCNICVFLLSPEGYNV